MNEEEKYANVLHRFDIQVTKFERKVIMENTTLFIILATIIAIALESIRSFKKKDFSTLRLFGWVLGSELLLIIMTLYMFECYSANESIPSKNSFTKSQIILPALLVFISSSAFILCIIAWAKKGFENLFSSSQGILWTIVVSGTIGLLVGSVVGIFFSIKFGLIFGFIVGIGLELFIIHLADDEKQSDDVELN